MTVYRLQALDPAAAASSAPEKCEASSGVEDAAQRRQGPRAPARHVTVIPVTLDILLR
jgi:hypothetical protein